MALQGTGGDARQVAPAGRESGNCRLRARPHLCAGAAPACAERCLRLALRHCRRCPSLLSSAVPRSSRHAIKQAVKGSSQAARSARKFIKERHERRKLGHWKGWCRGAVGLDGGNLCSSRLQNHTCKRVQVASGQLVLEIHPRYPGMAPFLQNRAVIDGTWASPLETGVCQPRKKNALHPSEHSDIPVLVPNLQEGHLIQSLSTQVQIFCWSLFPRVQP